MVYNEACTQWLTLKLFYDNDDFEQGLVSNFIYPESVRELNILISNGINEDVIFSGFFEANINVSTMLMNNEQKSKWVDFVLKMSTSLEERVASFEMEQLQQKIADSKNKIQ